MSDFQAQITKLVDTFVLQVTTVARQAAMQTLNAALGVNGGKSVIGSTSVPRVRRAKGEKRPAQELESLRTRTLEFILGNPGLRVEELNRQLGTTTKDLALPLRKVVGEGALRTEGVKRSTKYFPVPDGPRSATGSKRRKKA